MGSKYRSKTMANNTDGTMAETQTRFLEMKSVQPYSTTDEYIYAMKEDLADWLSNMYPEWRPITAENFLECLENGVLLCQHANNVNDAARKAYALKLVVVPLNFYLEDCKYRYDARPQTFNARDNVSQFIKWARRVVGVREVLMFESDDLILRKNEKNFLLCLLEIARYGSKFGVSVPAIIQLEDEIEREIQRDKQSEIMSFTELRRLQREEEKQLKNHQNHSGSHGKYSKLLKFVRHDQNNHPHHSNHHETSRNIYNTFSISHSNGANWLRQRISRIPKLTHSDKKKRHNGDESNETSSSTDMTMTNPVSKREPELSRTLSEFENKIEIPTSSSQLHKTVVQMTDTCSCAQRFPVVRIGEGKYRIGESGTIIFIRILRYHVMVRVGGGWDTLENYLNKHDPCRRSAGKCRTLIEIHSNSCSLLISSLVHRRLDVTHHHHQQQQHSDIPILPLSNATGPLYSQKTNPYGKAVTIKTEEYPLSRPTHHDTNLNDAQLIITRDNEGRHRIEQITYKSEEDLFRPSSTCSHHHSPSPVPKVKSARGTGNIIPPSSMSSSTVHPTKEFVSQSSSAIPTIKTTDTSGFSEFHIDNVDDYISPYLIKSGRDFDLNDIHDALNIQQKSIHQINDEDDTTRMDEDSLESCPGTIDESKSMLPPSPVLSNRSMLGSKGKPGGYCTALYLAQKKKQLSASSRSTTLLNIHDESSLNRSQSPRKSYLDPLDRLGFHDISKLDRDSGFDEQDFRCERLHSAGDEDNSSLSSIRSSLGHSTSSETHQNQSYRENKAYELRLKALDYTRVLNDQSSQDFRGDSRRNFNYTSTRTLTDVQPLGQHKYRKHQATNYQFQSSS